MINEEQSSQTPSNPENTAEKTISLETNIKLVVGIASAERIPGNNQDAWYYDPTTNSFGMFDGVSNSPNGAEAASQAAIIIRNYMLIYEPGIKKNQTPIEKAAAYLGGVLKTANTELSKAVNAEILYQNTKNNEQKNPMNYSQTTAAIGCFVEAQNEAYLLYAHVGNTRIAVAHHPEVNSLRFGELTLDQERELKNTYTTYEAAIIAQRRISNTANPNTLEPKDLKIFKSNVIEQALGFFDEISPDVAFYKLKPGDRILVYTDGLEVLTSKEIAEILRDNTDNQQAATALIKLANTRREKGSHPRAHDDDISAMVISFESTHA